MRSIAASTPLLSSSTNKTNAIDDSIKIFSTKLDGTTNAKGANTAARINS
jgi:hypothetical protein